MLNKYLDSDRKTFTAMMDIAALIQKAGGRAFLVGGCVRDALRGKPSKDMDMEVYGLSPETLTSTVSQKYRVSSVGMSFGVFKVHNYDIDLSLPRRENKTGAGHRGFQVKTDPELTFGEAAARRDFTINAIMYDPLSGETVDPCGGMEDLRKGILRHCSSHFSEDPLRVLRAMQFAGRLGFTVTPETAALCSELLQDELAKERIAGEWEKLLLNGVKPSLGLEFLRQCGWIKFYPELQALIGCRQDPRWHPEGDVWIHTLAALDAAVRFRTGNKDDDLTMMLAVLCHDLGKPSTSVEDDEGHISSREHPAAGAVITERFIKDIWNRQDIAAQTALLVKYHMEPYFFVRFNSGNNAYKRLALRAKRLDLLHAVAQSDYCGVALHSKDDDSLLPFLDKARELSLKAAVPKPLVLGRHLLQLGMKPGPQIGMILHKCFEAQLDDVFTTPEEGVNFAKKQFPDYFL